ncbi:S9 family peptidase [Chitinimonas sp.]|uniref:S9 family peptidase n=1 Tax=Chitinimonas sp. TaxID=1934313 RepID=UPI002F92C595
MKTTGSLGAAILAALMSSVLLAAGTPVQPPSVESFFTNPSILDAVLSPEGKQVALVLTGPTGRQVLAVAPTDKIEQLHVVAAASNTDVVMARWVNEKRLFFRTADLKREGSKTNASGYVVEADGSQTRQILVGSWEYNQEETGSNIKRRALPAEYNFFQTLDDGSDDIVVYRTTYNNVDNTAEARRLYRFNTVTRNLSAMFEGAQPKKSWGWVLDTERRPRIAISHDKGRRQIWLRDLSNDSWAELGNFDDASGEGWNPEFFDFNDNLYVRVEREGSTSELYRYDLKQRRIDDEPTVSIKGFDFEGYPEFDSRARQLLGVHYTSDAKGTVWTNKQMAETQKMLDGALPATINTISCGFCLSSPVMLVSATSDKQPTRYYLYRKAEQTLVELGNSYPDIKPEQMGVRDFVHYPARDGLSIPAYITVPPGVSKGPFPTVVLVHGGPYVRGGYWEWDAEAQFLATRGYLVIQPEFRGSTGFGFEHYSAGWKQWGLTMQDDLADAAKWAIGQGMSDPKRIAIAGASYGGYATLMGLVKNPELFRAGIDWAGVTDINLMFAVDKSSESDASIDWLEFGSKTLIGDPRTDEAVFRKVSPLERAAEIKQPVLLAHGGLDRRVPIVHASKFRSVLGRSNPQLEWVEYPEEGHGWLYEKNRIDFWKRVEAFLDKNLKSPG